jgi:exodeoxyribonuclease-3
MKLISWNVNGLRAVHKKAFLDVMKKWKADFVFLQEIKAQESSIPEELLQIDGYNLYLNCALKKGYSGVAVYAKEKPLKIERNLEFKRFDEEGRMLRLDYKNFTLVNLYLPHGGRGKENLEYKLETYNRVIAYLNKLRSKNVIIAGDFNIAREDIDLARPGQNRNNIMFTPEERMKLEELFTLGFRDTFRIFHKNGGHYTWWPYFANARERNLGWRIDYALSSEHFLPRIKKGFILDEIRGSDHCPVGIIAD